jgi:hypothetical protein
MVADSLFSTLLPWLALATGDEAKNGCVPTLEFTMPEVAPEIMQLSPRRPAERACCAMGQPLLQRASLSLDPSTLWENPHKYRFREETLLAERTTDAGGTIGFVYTRHGGFIDLGHARDFIDLTRFFTDRYRDVARLPIHRGDLFLFSEGADISLLAEQTASSPDLAICALLGAKLAFEYSIWHEIESYFSAEKYSSFAPEDLFSNAVGVVAGFRALFDSTDAFDVAADRALKEVLELLGPVPMEITETATQYVKNRWWKIGILPPGPQAIRRNFLQAGAIKPWLVTDLAISGRESQATELARVIGKPPAATITIPTHYNGIFLEGRARLVFRNPMQEIKDLVPTISEIRSIDLLTVSSKVRDLAQAQEGATIDRP